MNSHLAKLYNSLILIGNDNLINIYSRLHPAAFLVRSVPVYDIKTFIINPVKQTAYNLPQLVVNQQLYMKVIICIRQRKRNGGSTAEGIGVIFPQKDFVWFQGAFNVFRITKVNFKWSGSFVIE